VIGRAGLGWGLGLHETPKYAKYLTREGDGTLSCRSSEFTKWFGLW